MYCQKLDFEGPRNIELTTRKKKKYNFPRQNGTLIRKHQVWFYFYYGVKKTLFHDPVLLLIQNYHNEERNCKQPRKTKVSNQSY